MKFKDQTVVVTGGTRGIGKALAGAFLEAGARVIATGTSRVKPSDCRAEYHPLDFTKPRSVADFESFLRRLPRIDALVNNAGINIIKPAGDLTPREFERVHQVDLAGPFRIIRAVLPPMTARGYGRIVNIASIWSVITKPHRAAYSAAKSGLAGLTRTLASELAEDGILVNAVSPGFTLTEMTATNLSATERRRISRQIPIGRMARPIEMAPLVLMLASRENTYITGQNMVIDGGFSII